MLLELARESLVDGWDEVRGQSRPGDIEKFTADLVSGFRDEFFPSLQAVVELGLLIVKNEGEDEWFSAAIDVLIDALEASRGLNWLKSSYMLQRPDLLPWWKPAFDIYTGIRAIAAYAVLRNRLKYLGSILPRTVSPITIDDRVLDKSPILFWPFGDVSFLEGWHIQGRAAFLWKERVAGALMYCSSRDCPRLRTSSSTKLTAPSTCVSSEVPKMCSDWAFSEWISSIETKMP
jgi:hypothetical protein